MCYLNGKEARDLLNKFERLVGNIQSAITQGRSILTCSSEIVKKEELRMYIINCLAERQSRDEKAT